MKKASRPEKILHFPTNTGGHPFGLSRREREAGQISYCILAYSNRFEYKCDFDLSKNSNFIFIEIKKVILFVFAIFYFDTFHFNYGLKFFPFMATKAIPGEAFPLKAVRYLYYLYSKCFGTFDIWILKKLGKKILVTFHGDDIRQGDFSKKKFPIHFVNEVGDAYYSAVADSRKRSLIKLYDKYANQIFALNPDLLWVLPKRAQFQNYKHLLPMKELYCKTTTPQKITILHAPSSREVKGTKYVLAAIENLKKRGLDIELTLVENRTYEEAVSIYKNADLAIDQLLAGWYGAFAVDVMQFGVPVIGYIRESDLELIPVQMRNELPIINCDPSNLEAVLIDTISKLKTRKIDFQSFQTFVKKWH